MPKQINAQYYEVKMNTAHAKRTYAFDGPGYIYDMCNKQLNDAREAYNQLIEYNHGIKYEYLTVLQTARTIKALHPYNTWSACMQDAWKFTCPKVSVSLPGVKSQRINLLDTDKLKAWVKTNLPGVNRLTDNWHYKSTGRYCYRCFDVNGKFVCFLYVNRIN